jgi:hypothetical protein
VDFRHGLLAEVRSFELVVHERVVRKPAVLVPPEFEFLA